VLVLFAACRYGSADRSISPHYFNTPIVPISKLSFTNVHFSLLFMSGGEKLEKFFNYFPKATPTALQLFHFHVSLHYRETLLFKRKQASHLMMLIEQMVQIGKRRQTNCCISPA